ncbi:hypothetical protein OF66_2003 [Seleniivibrio woodruffii]|uniref:Uncharacterized protein n=1 Tax=Seleniivibrio woodruffii TaxID=1078050 RepID=A0A4R1K8R0_9BACT|nr:hypothetical protein C8D98_1627 [Seleniivibrio woodruffii]TVZ36378.1 hypothetical protein OF66_2003 [Seleniivibrio woodruffii]
MHVNRSYSISRILFKSTGSDYRKRQWPFCFAGDSAGRARQHNPAHPCPAKKSHRTEAKPKERPAETLAGCNEVKRSFNGLPAAERRQHLSFLGQSILRMVYVVFHILFRWPDTSGIFPTVPEGSRPGGGARNEQAQPGRTERGRTGGRERSERGRPRTTATKASTEGKECIDVSGVRQGDKRTGERTPEGGEAASRPTGRRSLTAKPAGRRPRNAERPSRQRKRAAHRERESGGGRLCPKAASEDEADKAKQADCRSGFF